MINFPNAKINLGLNILSRRSDGYHNLETVFYPIGIKDALEIIPNTEQEKDTFYQTGLQLDTPADGNLVMKALKLMRERYAFPYLEVHLLKTIPFGAGLGGGSADATFMIKLINETFKLNATKEEMATIALKLGADCPFFIYNKPVIASGIGEKIEDTDLNLQGYSFVIVKPDIYVSTREAFSGIQPTTPKIRLKEILQQPLKEWRENLENDFEKTIFSKYPAIEAVKQKLYAIGAEYASMSGTGSSVFGIFEHKPQNIETFFPESYIWIGKGL